MVPMSRMMVPTIAARFTSPLSMVMASARDHTTGHAGCPEPAWDVIYTPWIPFFGRAFPNDPRSIG